MDGTLSLVGILAAGITAGTLLAVLVAVVPTVRAMTAAEGHAFHRQFDPRVDRFNPLLVAVAVVAAIALLFVDGDDAAMVLRVIGIAGSVAIGVVSILFCIPVNRSIAKWKPDAIEEGAWRSARARWNRFHGLRTLASLVAFGCYVAAVLV